MNKGLLLSALPLVSSLLPAIASAQAYQNYEQELLSDTAVISVTGMRFTKTDEYHQTEDPSVAEHATVRITDEGGRVLEKKTEAFTRKFRDGRVLYSADFPVKFDSVYDISITFQNGTVIRIEDYRLDASWKRHHYFHSTDGNKSPASILRKQVDEQSGLWCFVYSLFPLKNYKASGGTQVE